MGEELIRLHVVAHTISCADGGDICLEVGSSVCVCGGGGGGGDQIMTIFDLLLTHGKRRSYVYCHYSNLLAHLYRLISLSFFTF